MRLWTDDGGRDIREDHRHMFFSRVLWTAKRWKWTIYVSAPVALRPPQEGPTGTTALREDGTTNRINPRTGIMELALHSNPFPSTRRLTDMVGHDLGGLDR